MSIYIKIKIFGGILKNNLGSIVRKNLLFVILLVIIIITSFFDVAFFSIQNITNILRQISVVGIIACGVTFVLISGGIDLSVGAIVSMSGVVGISIINTLGFDVIAIVAAIGVGILVGFGNGIIISRINGKFGETFIITFAMQTIVGAAALLYTGGLFLLGKGEDGIYSSIGKGYAPIVVFVIVAFVLGIILEKTKYGRTIRFIGGNMEAARMSGLRVKRYRTINYIICGMTASIAAVIITSRVNSASPLGGIGYELDALAAVVVGGTSLSGGSGSILKTILGVVVIGVLGNALNIINVTAYPQMMVKGVIIVLAVGLDIWNKRIKLREINK